MARSRGKRRWRRRLRKLRAPLLYALGLACAVGLFLAGLRALSVPPEARPPEPAARQTILR